MILAKKKKKKKKKIIKMSWYKRGLSAKEWSPLFSFS